MSKGAASDVGRRRLRPRTVAGAERRLRQIAADEGAPDRVRNRARRLLREGNF